MSDPQPKPTTPVDTRPKPRDPFGPPLGIDELREVFRRLGARPWPDQEAFVGRVNWNLVDAGGEQRLMLWIIGCLIAPDPARQSFALKTLDKLPHHKRARHVALFQDLLPALDFDLQERLKGAFGPILGGPRKKSNRPTPPPAPEPKAASVDDLAKLKDFFGKSGGAR